MQFNTSYWISFCFAAVLVPFLYETLSGLLWVVTNGRLGGPCRVAGCSFTRRFWVPVGVLFVALLVVNGVDYCRARDDDNRWRTYVAWRNTTRRFDVPFDAWVRLNNDYMFRGSLHP